MTTASAESALWDARDLLGLTRVSPPTIPLAEVARLGPPPQVVLSYGLGVDSTAILTRLCTEPGLLGVNLDELAVLTAGTGHEWPRTHEVVTRHVLPLLASRGVRYIQLARRGPSEADGIDITSDTRHPRQLVLRGLWTLANEMFDGGTVPQTCGGRTCSLHFKGFPLDTVITAFTHGRPYRHLMGYSTEETRRSIRDTSYNTTTRTGEYPLQSWGWDRERSQNYLNAAFRTVWPKSACTFCPFALSTVSGKAAVLSRFVEDPHAGLLALAMEYTATCLNPTQGLIAGDRLLALVRTTPGTERVQHVFAWYLARVPWAVYHVRRTATPRSDGRHNYARALDIVTTGTRPAMLACLAHRGTVVRGDPRCAEDTHPRVWIRRRPAPSAQPEFPLRILSRGVQREEFYALAPATAVPKIGRGFTTAWTTTDHNPAVV